MFYRQLAVAYQQSGAFYRQLAVAYQQLENAYQQSPPELCLLALFKAPFSANVVNQFFVS